MEVLVIDIDEEKVNEYVNVVFYVVVGDLMDEGVLKSLGICNFDYVIVVIGDNI